MMHGTTDRRAAVRPLVSGHESDSRPPTSGSLGPGRRGLGTPQGDAPYQVNMSIGRSSLFKSSISAEIKVTIPIPPLYLPDG